MTNDVDLLASYWTISGGEPHTDHEYSPYDFEERVKTASRAGFRGFGIWHADLEHVQRKYTLREMRQILDDNGIRFVELEFLNDWFLDGERKKQSDERKRKLFAAADVLRPYHIKVGDFFQETCPMDRLVESFAVLCREAAAHGTKIGFELMPFAMIRTLAESLAMVQGAGEPNGGIAFDMWHIAKLRIPYEEVARVPRQYIVSVELNDGTFEAPWSLHEDTINHRRLCGEGEFDVKGFVCSLQKAGYAGPWGIEVLSEDLRRQKFDQVLPRAFTTTMAQFQ
ncbi:MAG TPA: sugar phosphate isomerase/epimerase [Terriglobales bacterium]|nr:sugar phosphate isomerase/epimerase [Terriglobales bacterium]